MTEQSDEFEQLNERIARLVQGRDATVTWNHELPDPDRPEVLRQIDVMIQTADGRSLSVECRLRAGRQNVMWIEELIGRKLSLQLDGMIAVSDGGFTSLARTKANRFGIALYDFISLSDEEIASWKNAVRVEAGFVQFDDLKIHVVIGQAAVPGLSQNPMLSFDDSNGYVRVMDLVRDDALAHVGQPRSAKLDPFGFTVDGVPLREIRCDYSAKLATVAATCTAVSSVGAPGTSVTLRDIAVQKFDHSVPEIIQSGQEAHLLVDVTKLVSPSDALLHEIKVIFPAVTKVSRYELVGTAALSTRTSKIELLVFSAP